MLNLDKLQAPTEQIQKRKVGPYTISRIKDIDVYRVERKAFEEQWRKEFLKREAKARMIAVNHVVEQDKQITLTEAEEAELKYRQTRDDDDVYKFTPKVRFEPGHWDETNKLEANFANSYMKLTEEAPKSTFLDKVKQFAANLMKEGFGW